MAACHLLTYIEQQAIVALLGDGDGALEDMTFTNLALTAFCGGDIDNLFLTSTILFLQGHALICGVEFRHAIVVPQDAIAFARQKHRDGYLCVHLGKAS